MRRKLIAVLVSNLFLGCSAAYAQETGLKWTGEVSLGLRYVHESARDPSKFREYRDLDTSPITVLDLKAENDTHRFNIFAENIGKDDQYIDIRGTQFGQWKFRLYDNELRHRFGSGPGALSPFSGMGSNTLTAVFPNANVASWNGFDDSLKRRDLGGMAEWSARSPWYVRFDGNQVTRKGIKVIGSSQGTSPGNGSIDLPAPVDWKTQNASLEAGYQGPQQHFAISAFYSKFENDNDVLRWSNGFFGGVDTSVLPADNQLWRIGANGNWRGLPWGSTIAGRVTYSKLTNDVAVLPTMLAAGGATPSTASSSPVYQGEIINTTASFALNSHPMRALDTKLYYNYREKDNNSTQITFTPTAASGLQCGGQPCTPELFAYKKHNIGLDAFYRVNPENRVGAGYDFLHTERHRPDFPKTVDNKYFVEWKNSSFDIVDARLKYQYLHRSSVVFPFADPGNPIDAFVRRFDFANVNQHLVKAKLDFNPVPLLDFGFDVIYKKNDFRDTELGRTQDERQEFYASIGYGDPKSFRVLLFADVELVKLDSRHRVGTGNPDPNAPPQPAAPAVSTTYTWTAKNKDRSWQTGIAVDWLPYERLKLSSSLIWSETRGTVDFAAQPGTILAAPFLPIGNFDNTRRLALNLKGIYKVDRQWEITAGYAYERYRYDDIGFEGFRYVAPGGTAAQNSYYTGQTAFQNHNANIFYAYMTYRFR